MKTASWVLLTVLGTAMLALSLLSAYVAYATERDEFGQGGTKLSEVAAWRPEVARAIQARRGTAAAFAAAYAALFLSVVLGPYRRGDVWAWWSILGTSALLAALTLARIPLLGTRLGAATGGIQLAVVVLALLLDVGRVRSGRSAR